MSNNKRYLDVVIKECNYPDEYFHIDMTNKAIGSHMLAGTISHRVFDNKELENHAEFYNKLCDKKILVVIDNIFEAKSEYLLNPGFLIKFGAECIEDLPENWGLVIKNAIERFD